jgi:hypothetical protein
MGLGGGLGDVAGCRLAGRLESGNTELNPSFLSLSALSNLDCLS